jgi:Tfp pilus assembly protein PilX
VNARGWRSNLGLALAVVLLVLIVFLIATSIGGSGH